MKRSCSAEGTRLLSGLISGWLLYCSPPVCAPSRASGCGRMKGPTCGAVEGDSFMKHEPTLACSPARSLARPRFVLTRCKREPGRGHERHVDARYGFSRMQNRFRGEKHNDRVFFSLSYAFTDHWHLLFKTQAIKDTLVGAYRPRHTTY